MRLGARIDRLRRLTRAEVVWRARTMAQRMADRAAAKVRLPAWRRDSLARAVDPAQMPEVEPLLAAGRFEDAHHALAAHVRQRPVRSLLHPTLRAPLRARVLAACPSAADDARTRGDRIVNGDYDLLGYEGLRFTAGRTPIDWHLDPVSRRRAPAGFWADVPYLEPASGDHKVIWELNRHQHWLALGRAWWLTGDHRYRARFIAEVTGWMVANPPRMGVNWASALELAFRTMSWTWAIELFADGDVPGEPTWLVDLLLGLDVQLRHVERNLSWYFSPNTHLLGEALALYVCGRTWPELRDGARWARLGGDILVGEIDRQVLADGFHAERSTHYHRYALDFYLLALATARVTRDDDRTAAFANVADRMATTLLQVTDAAGRVPLIGDDDGGQLFPITGHPPDDVGPTLAWAASLLGRPELAIGPSREPALWLTAALDAQTVAAPMQSTPGGSVVLATSGYYVSRRDEAMLVFDAGALGFLNAGHAHADALAVTLSAGVHRLFIDAGTGTYTMDSGLRDRLRSSQLHNTVTIDGRSQSVPAGPFHWTHSANAHVQRAVVGATLDLFHAATDAFLPLRHERIVFATGAHTWIVADRLTGPGGTGRHRASVHWHVDPEWAVASDGRGAWALHHRGGSEARLAMPDLSVELFRGDQTTGLGWVAPIYGRLIPAPTLRGTCERIPPFWMISTIEVGAPHVGEAATTLLEVPSSNAGSACAVLAHRPRHTEVTLLRASPDREMLTVAVEPRGTVAIATDAAALHARVSNSGRLERVCVVDATVCRFDGAAPVTITCPGAIADLEVRFDQDGAAAVATSRPRGDLTISLDAGSRPRAGGNAPPVVQSVMPQRMSCVESPASPTR